MRRCAHGGWIVFFLCTVAALAGETADPRLLPPGAREGEPVHGSYVPIPVPVPRASLAGAEETPAAADLLRPSPPLGFQLAEETEIFYWKCRHIRAQNLKEVVENFLSYNGTVSFSNASDILIVSDVKGNIERLKEIVRTVDVRVPQVLVEAQIVELTLDATFEKEAKVSFDHLTPGENDFLHSLASAITTPGMDLSLAKNGSLAVQFVRNKSEGRKNLLGLYLRYLEERGKAKILSTPNLILKRGFQGSIITGQEIPVIQQTWIGGGVNTNTEFKKVGVKLDVLPLLITEDTAHLIVQPEVSSVTGFTSGPDG
ncbi:MAG: hypothetical protein V1918_04625, partial [Planctomycetota bacterium]